MLSHLKKNKKLVNPVFRFRLISLQTSSIKTQNQYTPCLHCFWLQTDISIISYFLFHVCRKTDLLQQLVCYEQFYKILCHEQYIRWKMKVYNRWSLVEEMLELQCLGIYVFSKFTKAIDSFRNTIDIFNQQTHHWRALEGATCTILVLFPK